MVLQNTVGRVVGVLKQIDPVSEKEEAIQALVENLKVGAERKSNVISIEYDADSPELAQAIVQASIDRYRQEHSRIHRTEGSFDFFDTQRDELKQRVARCGGALRAAKERIGLASVAGQQAMVEAQLLRVRNATLDAYQRVAEDQAKASKIQSLLTAQSPMIQSEERLVPNTGRDQLRAQLYSLQVQRMAWETKMSDDNPRLQALRKQEQDALKELAEASTADRAEVTQSLNAIYQQLSIELVEAEARLAGDNALLEALAKQEAELLTDVNRLNEAELEIRQLESELKLAETSYVAYSESFEDARIGDALNQSTISNVSVAQAPTFQEKPVSPSKALLVLLGMAAMVFGSSAIVSGMHLLHHSEYARSQQSSSSETTVQIPRVVTVPHQRRYRRVDQ